MNKFKFASNETPSKLRYYENYEILTKNYHYNIGLIWCWNEKKEDGILFRFEHSEDKEVIIDENFVEVKQ